MKFESCYIYFGCTMTECTMYGVDNGSACWNAQEFNVLTTITMSSLSTA